MNRSELAAILSHTHTGMAAYNNLQIQAQNAERSPSSQAPEFRAPPLSPRQLFQSQIRSLACNKDVKSEADCETAMQDAGHHLQHVSSLRVQHRHSQCTTPRAGPLRTMSEPSSEPDFIIAEREAWRRPPRSPYKTQRPGHEVSTHVLAHPPSQEATIIPQPPEENTEPLPQPQKHQKQIRPLRPLESPHASVNIDERPKTSHGPRPGLLVKFPTDQDDYDTDSDSAASAATNQPARRSKFMEGSMNQRSVALASSWHENAVNSSDDASADTESDATPRPLRDLRPSNSMEREDVEPMPISTTTPKQGFSRFRGTSSKDGEKTKAALPKKARKGLKKSLSTWNFHHLGEKMKIFGGSTSDLTPKAANDANSRQNKLSSIGENIHVLNERKRKADIAYAAQFGLKKQRSNIGLSEDSSRPIATPGHASTSNTTSRRRRVSSPLATAPSVDCQSETDLRKKPSRRDLLKENQRLRELLRESQSQHFSKSVSPLSQNLVEHSKAPAVVISSETNVPPIPNLNRRHPKGERQVLGSLHNSTRSGHGRVPKSGPGVGSLKRRPVSVIAEENEDSTKHGKEWSDMEAAGVEGHQTESWQWPDDVF